MKTTNNKWKTNKNIYFQSNVTSECSEAECDREPLMGGELIIIYLPDDNKTKLPLIKNKIFGWNVWNLKSTQSQQIKEQVNQTIGISIISKSFIKLIKIIKKWKFP